MDTAFVDLPRAAATPLPPLAPASRLQRQIEAMTAAELARWIVPAQAERIASAELFPSRWGRLAAAYLWQAPRPTDLPGLCRIDGWLIGFNVPNERSLSYEQHLNPPLVPASMTAEQRFRVVGSTRGPEAAEPDCATGQPYWNWSVAPSAEIIHRAAALIEQAQIRAASSGRLGFTLRCSQWRMDAAQISSPDHRCADSRGLLRDLAPHLIKRVNSTPCEGEFSRLAEGDCLAVQYQDPAAPDTHSFYLVRIAGTRTPLSIDIVQGMLPPH